MKSKIKYILNGFVLYFIAGILMGAACIDDPYSLRHIKIHLPTITYIETKLNGVPISSGNKSVIVGSHNQKETISGFEGQRFYRYLFAKLPNGANICGVNFPSGYDFKVQANQKVNDSRLSCLSQ
jgi:hypothetical protein